MAKDALDDEFEDIEIDREHELEDEDDIEIEASEDEESGDLDEDDLKEYSAAAKAKIKELEDKLRDKDEALKIREDEYHELEGMAFQVADQNEKLKKQVGKPPAPQTDDLDKQIEAVKKKMKKAFEDGDAEAHADLMDEFADLKAKKAIGAAAPREEGEEKPATPPPIRIHPRVQAWVRRNPWFTNPENADAIAASAAMAGRLERQGITPSNDQYFTEIDAQMRKRFPELFEAEKKPAKSDPVTSGSGRSTPGVKKKVKVELTPWQVRFAKNNNIPLEKMAAEVARQNKMERNK